MHVNLSSLTLAGWLLTLLTIAIIVVLMIFSGALWNELLPPGRYPAILLAAPGLGIGIAFFALGAFVLRSFGISVMRPGHEQNAGQAGASKLENRADQDASPSVERIASKAEAPQPDDEHAARILAEIDEAEKRRRP